MLDPARFGFAPDYPLAARLDALRALYDRDLALDWSTPAQRRKAAERLAKTAGAWLSAARDIGRAGGGYLTSADLYARMVKCREEALAAVAKLKGAPALRGELPHRAESILVANLHRLYCTGTGKAHRFTYDPATGTYGGPFVAFALVVAGQWGVDLTAQFIARHLPD